jgi:general secretion pathway protein A
MNQKLLALFGLKHDPFSPEIPTEAVYLSPKIQNFCWRIEQAHLREGGWALIHGYERGLVMERIRSMLLIRLRSVHLDLLIIEADSHIESSQLKRSGSLFHRGSFRGRAVAATRSKAFRFVSRFARA